MGNNFLIVFFFLFSCRKENVEDELEYGSFEQLDIKFVEVRGGVAGSCIAYFDVRNDGASPVVLPVVDYGNGEIYHNAPDFKYRLIGEEVWRKPDWSYGGVVNPVVICEKQSIVLRVDVTKWLSLGGGGKNTEFIMLFGEKESDVFLLQKMNARAKQSH